MVGEQNEFLRDVCQLITKAQDMGFQVSGGELFRTAEQQDIYFKTGKSKTMNSLHLNRLAIDLNFFKDGKQVTDKESLCQVGNFWESLDPKNSWGGNGKTFVDTPHFSRGTDKPEFPRAT
ncbi:MAG: M15 family peptidase [Caulobacteraceae bacterium]|nr:M15 family peptidase [Caulobacteraceae bacterium]